MGHTHFRGAPQDDEFRLRSARSYRATPVCARPCDPTIARVRNGRWDLARYCLSGDRVLRNGSIAVIEQRHAEAQQQLVDGGLVLLNGAIELALPLLIGVTHAHGDAIGEARTAGFLDGLPTPHTPAPSPFEVKGQGSNGAAAPTPESIRRTSPTCRSPARA